MRMVSMLGDKKKCLACWSCLFFFGLLNSFDVSEQTIEVETPDQS